MIIPKQPRVEPDDDANFDFALFEPIEQKDFVCMKPYVDMVLNHAN